MFSQNFFVILISILVFFCSSCLRKKDSEKEDTQPSEAIYLFGPNLTETKPLTGGCKGVGCPIQIVAYLDLQDPRSHKMSDLLRLSLSKFPGKIVLESKPILSSSYPKDLGMSVLNIAFCAHMQKQYWGVHDFMQKHRFSLDHTHTNPISQVIERIKRSDHVVKSSLDLQKLELCAKSKEIKNFSERSHLFAKNQGVKDVPYIKIIHKNKKTFEHKGLLMPSELESFLLNKNIDNSLESLSLARAKADSKKPRYLLKCYHYTFKHRYTHFRFWRNWKFAKSKNKVLFGLKYNYLILDGRRERNFFFVSHDQYKKALDACKRSIPKNSNLSSMVVSSKLLAESLSLGQYTKISATGKVSLSERSRFDRVVVFGDSLSDVGNLQKERRILPNEPYFLGRFSNGFIWTDYFQSVTKIPLLNRSYGGSVSGSPVPVHKIKSFDQFKSLAQNLLTGNMKKTVKTFISKRRVVKSYFNKTLFFMWTGANNYLSIFGKMKKFSKMYDSNKQKLDQKILEVTDAVIQDIEESVKMLEKNGARNFVFISLPDISQTPMCINEQKKHKNAAYICKQTTMIHSKNIEDFSKKSSNYLFVDFFDFFNKILEDKPSKLDTLVGENFGFSLNESDPCYKGYYGYEKYLGLKIKTCAGSDKTKGVSHLFFDEVHPNTKAHFLISRFILQILVEKKWFYSKKDFFQEGLKIIKTKKTFMDFNRF